MSLARAPLKPNDSATQSDWFAPPAVLIVWLAHLFEQVARPKCVRRTTKFKPNWRDHWQGLRQLEWMRYQVLAACAARLLAGQDLEFDFTLATEPPADYGGPPPHLTQNLKTRLAARTCEHASARLFHRTEQRISRRLSA